MPIDMDVHMAGVLDSYKCCETCRYGQGQPGFELICLLDDTPVPCRNLCNAWNIVRISTTFLSGRRVRRQQPPWDSAHEKAELLALKQSDRGIVQRQDPAL